MKCHAIAGALGVALALSACMSSASLRGDDPATWRCEASEPLPLDTATLFVRKSAEYEGIARETYANATAAMLKRARGLKRHTWFVILDADETLLDNSLYMEERQKCGLSFTKESWAQWEHDGDLPGAVPGGAAFVRAVHDAGGYVAIVTNRSASARDATLGALTRNNIAVEALLLLEDPAAPDKSPRWRMAGEAIAEATGVKPPKPIMWIGDQMGDLPRLGPDGAILGRLDQTLRGADPSGYDGIGIKLFLLPNPLYGAWD